MPPVSSPSPRNSSCTVRAYSFICATLPSPTVLPVMTLTADDMPFMHTYASEFIVLATLAAVMTSSVKRPRMAELVIMFTLQTIWPPMIGAPQRMKSRRNSLSLSRKCLRRSFSRSSTAKMYASMTAASTIREISVASAAPRTPMAGAPSLPKIST